jgi:hypothetical protein
MDTIIDPCNRLNSVSNTHRLAFLRAAGLRDFIAANTGPLQTALIHGGTVDLLSPGNNMSGIIPVFRSDTVSDQIAANFALQLIEASDDYKEAVEIMEPILAQIDQDNRQIVERQRAENEALVAEREAMERARAKALAAVDKDPAVLKARAALAALQPAPAPVDPAILKAREIAAATPRLGEPLGELASDADELAADLH